ncbi:MAG TPA: beta-ribofuranosylaminobenzene 5'-phosphate synthase family protein [Isosphaeraceae bacterium]|jgi:beta-RFAP synthase|nr:beta-ribofuranosylaminobenzene 5'-phosphate synthase family protein [Isosphaeraceae bacterium]
MDKTCLRLRTPSRLHFGLLAWNPSSARQFGSVGLMIEAPGLELLAQQAPIWQAEGPLARRALQVADRVSARLAQRGTPSPAVRFRILRAAPEHAGLGTGTQLGLAVARVLTTMAGLPDTTVATLAELADRGLRSGIGLHGFLCGGLLVDGGRRTSETAGIPPLLSRLEFPSDWSILVVLPATNPGLHGPYELQAFAHLPPILDSVTDRLCRLVLLGLLPAVAERDLPQFDAALTELQRLVGQSFAPAQGGIYAHADLEPIVASMRSEGLRGVGQSSWGPALYGFSAEPAEARMEILKTLRERFDLTADAAFWTVANATGSVLTKEAIPER